MRGVAAKAYLNPHFFSDLSGAAQDPKFPERAEADIDYSFDEEAAKQFLIEEMD